MAEIRDRVRAHRERAKASGLKRVELTLPETVVTKREFLQIPSFGGLPPISFFKTRGAGYFRHIPAAENQAVSATCRSVKPAIFKTDR